MSLLLPVLAFLFASALVGVAGLRLAGNRGTVIDRRLAELSGAPQPRPERKVEFTSVKSAFRLVGSRVPAPAAELSKVRLRLVQAGHRGGEALPIFYGIRITTAILAFVIFGTPLVFRPNVMTGLGGALLAYVAPGIILARMAGRRIKKIQLALADALDLLVVSVEAGLGLDQALIRVGDELEAAYPELAEELRIVNLELRAGKSRPEALRNLADRTGLEDVNSLVTILVQTDKFGTSVAQSLRVHSDVLRTKRRQRAEEAAAKTGVKMVFPLVFCIFPAIFVVTIGPAAIRFVQVLFPMVKD